MIPTLYIQVENSAWKCAKVLSSILLELSVIYACHLWQLIILLTSDYCAVTMFTNFSNILIWKSFNSGGAIKHLILTMGYHTYNIVWSFESQWKELNFSWCFCEATKGVGYPTEHSRRIVILHLISWDSKVWANEL